MRSIIGWYGSVLSLFVLAIWLLMQGTDRTDQSVAVRQGMHFFYEHCSGCHTLRYLPAAWTNHDSMVDRLAIQKGSVTKQQALRWFGVQPPDLSLIVTQRGQDWIKHYLTGFYHDSNRPFFTNNRLLPNTAMPDVLYPYLVDPQALDELCLFLTEVAEPDRAMHYRIGLVVISFLGMLLLIFCRLTRE